MRPLVANLRGYGDIAAGLLIVAAVIWAGIAVRRAQYRSTPHMTDGTGVRSSSTASGAVYTAPPITPATPSDLPFELDERSSKVGLVFTHQKLVPHESVSNIAPMLAAMAGAAVAVVDFDRDGWPDVYLTTGKVGASNALFRNNHDGTFTDVAEQAGLARVNETTASLRALFFDYDNDGYDDLLLTTTWCPRLFHNERNGTFKETTAGAGLTYCGWTHASNVIDYDGDGLLDLVIGGYIPTVDISHPSTLRFLWSSHPPDKEGGQIVAYHNEGNGHFKVVPGNLGLEPRAWVHAISVYRLFGGALQDMYFGIDFDLNQTYENKGNGNFVNRSRRIQADQLEIAGMAAEIADVDNDGLPAVYSSGEFEPGHVNLRNVMFKRTRDGKLVNVADERGVSSCGFSWGAKFVDFDNDGHKDLAVANGLLSANPKKDFWYQSDVMNGSSLQRDASTWPPMTDASFAGYQSKCVFHSENGRMVDVSDETEMGHDRSDGRGLAAIDFRNEGLFSLVEANVGEPAHFFQNVPKHHNHWIGFSLTGTKSNRDAFGTTIAVKLRDGMTQTQELEPGNGFMSESDHRLLFGLGPNPQIESIRIQWPLGEVQTLSSLDIDRYHELKEP